MSENQRTFGVSLPRFSKIDDSNRADHVRLEPEDEVYYLFEYTSGTSYSFSTTNQLIFNLKKKPSRAHLPDYKYKGRAISECAHALGSAIKPEWLKDATLVPVPPSKAKGDP